LVLAALLAFPSSAALAQGSQRPSITVAATISADAAGQVDFPIRISPIEAIPRNSFVRVRGLPHMAALSDGHSIAPGSWAVPITALSTLKMRLPPGAAGRSDISVTLVAVDGTVLGEARSILVVSVPRPDAGQARQAVPSQPLTILRAGTPQLAPERGGEAAGPAPKETPQGPVLSPEARQRALRFVERGEEQLREGNVAQARLLFERAADAGLAQGAMLLAATYDPRELQRLGVIGIQPDVQAARRWYQRARQLGSIEAERSLQRLGAN
jgi:hypothetical protein